MTEAESTGAAGSGHRRRGFERAASLLTARIRAAGEKRGFATARLLTHWAEIAGTEIGQVARPVKVSYGREGLGATLTLLTGGAHAPMLQMQLPRLRERVNACYGYNAISRIVITQTSAAGFAEDVAAFSAAAPPVASPAAAAAAREMAAPVADAGLRGALEALAGNVLSRYGHQKG